MDKSLKLTKKKIDTLLKNKEYIRDEQNRIVVEMTVQNDKNFLSEFSQTKTPVINTKVAEFMKLSMSKCKQIIEEVKKVLSNVI